MDQELATALAKGCSSGSDRPLQIGITSFCQGSVMKNSVAYKIKQQKLTGGLFRNIQNMCANEQHHVMPSEEWFNALDKMVPDSPINKCVNQGIMIPERRHATMPPRGATTQTPISKYLANSLSSKVAFSTINASLINNDVKLTEILQ